MKEIVWRVKKGWVYLVGIVLMVGFSALAYGEIDVMDAKENNGAPTQVSQDSEALVANDTKGGVTGNDTTTTSVTTQAKPKTKTVYRTVTVNQGSTTTSTVNSAPAPTTTKPPVKKDTVKLNITGVGNYTVEIKVGDTVFNALNNAHKQFGFDLDNTMDETWGAFVTKIGGIGYSSSLGFNSPDNKYWFLYKNGVSASEGASFVKVLNNDSVEWRYEKSSW